MNPLIYWGVVLAGAVTLLIEANRNFLQSLTATPFDDHPILKGVKVNELCTQSERRLGFAFYSLLYFAVYILALSSSEVFELLSNATQSSTQIGPTDGLDGQENDPLGLVAGGYGKPIMISAAIIALVSTKIAQPIENTVRSLSHRIAGIPRGVYEVIEKLHAIKFKVFLDPARPTRFHSIFHADFLKNRPQLSATAHYAQDIETIEEALLTIDLLSPALTGKLREQYFPFQNLASMHELSGKLETEIADFELKLRADRGADEKDLAELFDAAMLVANNSIALFAVQFIRNNRAIKTNDDSNTLKKLREEIGLDYQVELNSFGMGTLVAAIASIVFGCAVIWSWQSYERPLHVVASDKLKGQLVEVTEAAVPPGQAAGSTATVTPASGQASPDLGALERKKRCAMLTEAQVASLLDDKAGDAGPASMLPDGFAAAEKTPCAKTWEHAYGEAGNKRRYDIIRFVFKDIIPVLMAVAFAALPAILGREVRKEDNSWPNWNLRRIPFLRLVSMSLVPGVLAVVGVSLSAFLLFWIEAGFHLTDTQMTNFFQSKGVYFALHAGLGMIVAIGVLVLSDRHDEIYNELTCAIGLAFGIVAVGYYSLIILVSYPPGFYRAVPDSVPWWFTFHVREAVRYGFCALFFLLSYSVFVEMTEDPNGKTRSWVMSDRPVATGLRRVGGTWPARIVIGVLVLAVLAFFLAQPARAQDAAVPDRTDDAASANAAGTASPSQAEIGTGCSSGAADKCLRVGVRSAAQPFSYYSRTFEAAENSTVERMMAKSGPLRVAGYDGYMVYICDEVLRQLMTPGPGLPAPLASDQIDVVDVDKLMARKDWQGRDRLMLLGGEIDLLCDPATINLERVRTFAVSPPLFLTGVSYLMREGNEMTAWQVGQCPPKGKALIGVVGSTNAASHGIRAILEADEWKMISSSLYPEIQPDRQQGSACAMPEDGQVGGLIWAGKTHDEVAKEFCEGDIIYYVGDLEIILAYARRFPGCNPVPAAQSFTNDRYGIFAQIDYTKPWKALLIGRFFEVLNREIATSDSLLDRAYGAEFGDATKSRKLDLFFWSLRGARDP